MAAAGCLVASMSLGVAACGSSSSSSSSSSGGGGGGGSTVDVYSSLPLQGASQDQTKAMVQGIQLALSKAQNKAGSVKINYQSLDDSTAQMGNWEPATTASNARKVAQDKKAVAYIGEFNSGASAISIPILNEAAVPQISPANTYVGLTKNEPGVEKGEPQKYYPTGKRTYMRIVPRDKIQAAALLTQMKQDGCTKYAVANDKDTYGQGLARLIDQTGKEQNFAPASDDGIDPKAPNYRSLAQKIKGEGVNCFLFSGVTANGAVQLYKDVNAALPTAKLYGPDGNCESGFTNPKKGGIPASVGKLFTCTVATGNLKSYPGGTQFLKDFQAKYGASNPDPYAIYGYEAMQLVIDTLKKLGSNASDKGKVLSALMATKDRHSVLGTYSFDKDGDTTLTDYGVYKVGPDGNPKFFRTIKAST